MNAVDQKKKRELSAVRETVESIWIAIVLAFVLRAFLIEAFVIPTGSMAPRLMGEHWQLNCPACGFDYAYGMPPELQGAPLKDKTEAQYAVCPNCTYSYPFTQREDYARGGDRVLVMKYLYNFREPEVWDVVVFRNPQNNRDNYIKRLVGLPGETLEIVHGDIFYSTDYRAGDENWKIRRKPTDAQNAMWQVVFDNDYQPDRAMFENVSPDRMPPIWRAEGGNWDLTGQDGRKFSFSGGDEDSAVVFDAHREDFLPRYGYNDPKADRKRVNIDRDVSSDLKLSCVWAPSDNSTLTMELSGMGYTFKAQLTAAGKATLLCDAPDGVGNNFLQLAEVDIEPVSPGEKRSVSLENVDYRVVVRIDGTEVLASTDEQYYPDINAVKARLKTARDNPLPTPQVVISASGGPCELTHVKVYRDVYYTCPRSVDNTAIFMRDNPLGDYARKLQDMEHVSLPGWGDRPSKRDGGWNIHSRQGWATTDNPITLRKFKDSSLDEFFVLGDNSPASRDGRVWTEAAPTLKLWDGDQPLYQLGTMPRYNMIGKAFYVYWPAGYHVPGLPGLPIVPNFGRMRMIR